MVGVARAIAGALIFSLPMIMTMEMWQLGFVMDPLRLGLLLLVVVPALVGLSRYGGFRSTVCLRDDIADALVGVAVAFVTALSILWVFGQLTGEMSTREMVGKVALQMVPGSIGALLAQNQLGGGKGKEKRRKSNPSYWGELFLMGVGAVFLSLNIAPTEEVELIAYSMSPFQQVILIVASLILMHAFVYLVEFQGSHSRKPEETFWGVFLRFTVAGYAVVLMVSLFLLWVFARTDENGLQIILIMAVVLSFPGAIGAAVARLAL